MENDNVDSSQRNVIFLTRAENAERSIAVTEQIKKLQRTSNIDHEFSVILVPRRTLVCNKIFEDAGVLGDLSVMEFPLYFLPLEQDLLSLELEDSFGDLFLVSLSISVVYNEYLLLAAKRSVMCSSGGTSSHVDATKARVISPDHRKG